MNDYLGVVIRLQVVALSNDKKIEGKGVDGKTSYSENVKTPNFPFTLSLSHCFDLANWAEQAKFPFYFVYS